MIRFDTNIELKVTFVESIQVKYLEKYYRYFVTDYCAYHCILYFAWLDQMHFSFYIRHVHTLLGHMTKTAHLGESHMTNIHVEQFWSHVMNITHYLSHTTNTASVLCFIFIGMTPSAAFLDASRLVGDVKWQRLPHFNDYLCVRDD